MALFSFLTQSPDIYGNLANGLLSKKSKKVGREGIIPKMWAVFYLIKKLLHNQIFNGMLMIQLFFFFDAFFVFETVFIAH